MIFSSRLKLRGPDKSTVTDGPMIQDHAEAEQYGHQGLRKLPRLRLGRHALYYRDLGKDYFVPYHHIDRAFIRISECQPDDSPAYYYYRIRSGRPGPGTAEGDPPGDSDRSGPEHGLQQAPVQLRKFLLTAAGSCGIFQ